MLLRKYGWLLRPKTYWFKKWDALKKKVTWWLRPSSSRLFHARNWTVEWRWGETVPVKEILLEYFNFLRSNFEKNNKCNLFFVYCSIYIDRICGLNVRSRVLIIIMRNRWTWCRCIEPLWRKRSALGKFRLGYIQIKKGFWFTVGRLCDGCTDKTGGGENNKKVWPSSWWRMCVELCGAAGGESLWSL